MPKYRKRVWAGDVYEVEEFYSPRTIGKNYERGRRENLTSEEQQKRNLQIARKKLTRLINANFDGNDYFALLTYDRTITVEEARREISNFFKRLNRWRKNNGFEPLKYISVLETAGRPHHHILLNAFEGMSMKEALEILQSIWDRGIVKIKKLYKNQADNRLATYITKENIKKGAKRWSSSRNLQKPKIKIEQMKESKRKTSMRPPKGYRVVMQAEDYFNEIGWIRYMKAIREGGADYGGFDDERKS